MLKRRRRRERRRTEREMRRAGRMRAFDITMCDDRSTTLIERSPFPFTNTHIKIRN